MKENIALFTPTVKNMQQSAMWQFMASINQRYSLSLQDYSSLYQWSILQPTEFWRCIWEFCDVKASVPYTEILKYSDNMLDAKWFESSQLNFAENLLKYCHIHDKNRTAIIFHGENQVKRTLSFGELHQQVASIAAALKHFGVRPGDRVAGYLPNVPEAIIAMLATTSLGAIWSSCSPDFGFHGVLDRFSQIRPKVLFTADGYFFKGKTIDSLAIVDQLNSALNCISAIVVVSYIKDSVKDNVKANVKEKVKDKINKNTKQYPGISNLSKAHEFNKLVVKYACDKISYEQLPFNHPIYIMFSSGTTGVPKCIVHGAGGTLLQHLKELILHTNLNVDDRLFYFTTCGWMMWNWMVSGLATGASLVLYDGSPFYPTANRMMDLIDETKISVFGTSAKYLSALEKEKIQPINTHDLGSLRTILSTGSPLLPESFDYVYQNIKATIQLASISGGTDIISCFALGCPLLPVRRGELQCRGLGMDVDIYNEKGESITRQKGELVCKSPFPSMPIYFWNDKDQSKYKSAYFVKFQNIWAQGDYAELTEHNGLVIYGRSDAVLNPGGVRIGTAEIYRQVEKHPEVLESIAVGQQWKDDIRVILFVKLRDKLILDDRLKHNISQGLIDNATRRHVPAIIIQVTDIPRTISGKIVELAVRNVIHNDPVNNIDALANPEALDYFRNLNELQDS